MRLDAHGLFDRKFTEVECVFFAPLDFGEVYMCPLAVVVLLSVQHVQAVLLFGSRCKVSCGKWRRSGFSIEMVPKLPTELLLTACLHVRDVSPLSLGFRYHSQLQELSTADHLGFVTLCSRLSTGLAIRLPVDIFLLQGKDWCL